MSYGQPCSSRTTGPSAGPASAYPTLNRPALTCLSEVNEVFIPDFSGCGGDPSFEPVCASANGITASWVAARVIAPAPTKRRRSRLMARLKHRSQSTADEPTPSGQTSARCRSHHGIAGLADPLAHGPIDPPVRLWSHACRL